MKKIEYHCWYEVYQRTACFRKPESKKNPGWENCREIFHEDFKTLKIFCFWATNAKYSEKYLYDLETLLNIKDKYRSKVFEVKCDRHPNQIIKIETSPFWQGATIRKYFLTAFLKATNDHNPKERSLLECIEESDYFNDIDNVRNATLSFLQGKTVASGKGNWVERHYNEDIKFTYPKNKTMFKRNNPKTKLKELFV